MTRLLPLLSFLLLPGLAAAQSTDSAPATIHVTSRIVYVDVVVRDAAGHIVHGLTGQDFKLLEDGKPQTIDYFNAHVHVPTAIPVAPSVHAVPVPQPASGPEFSNAHSSGAVTILLFDLLNTSTPHQLVARKQMLRFLKELPPGRRVSVFVLTDHLRMIQSFTGSPELLAAAAKMLKPIDLHMMPSRTQALMESNRAREFVRQGGPMLGPNAVSSSVQSQDSDYELRAYDTIAALSRLAQMVRGYQGRKSLYWVSESFPVALDTTQNFLHQQLPVDAYRMTNILADARIAVYPVSVLGLDQGPSLIAYSDQAPSTKTQFFARGNLKSAMDDIAKQTGGHAIIGTNDLAGAMHRSLDDGFNYYTLAYQPQDKKWDKKFRDIRVELDKKSDTLTYRRGYFAYPGNVSSRSPAQELNVALQPDTPESTMLGLSCRIDLPGAQHASVLVHSTINAANLDLTASPDGHRRGQLLVMLVAFNDTSGKPEDQPDAPPQTSGLLNLDLTPAQYQNILKDGVAFTQKLQLPPGRYRLRLGVSDTSSHRLGTLDMPIVIPAQSAKK